MIPIGIGSAVRAFVGNSLGLNKPKIAKRLAFLSIYINGSIVVFLWLIVFLMRQFIA